MKQANLFLLLAVVIMTASCAMYMLRSSAVATATIRPMTSTDMATFISHANMNANQYNALPMIPPIDHRVVTEHSVDIVYTYVNRSATRTLEAQFQRLRRKDKSIASNSAQAHMYRDNGELCFSLRSVNQYMGWFKGNIHIVTNTVPEWLNLDHPRIRIVKENKILAKKNLPTFNSMALEANLHKIPDLKPHYIYFNDDFMFGRNVSLNDFYDTRDQCYQFYHLPVSLDKVKMTNPHRFALRNVHYLLDKEFPQAKKYPRHDLAHIPHFFNRSLAEEIYTKWKRPLERMMANKFRSANDLHFAHMFAYYVREQMDLCSRHQPVMPSCKPRADYCFGVQPTSKGIAAEMGALQKRAGTGDMPKFINVNDKSPKASAALKARKVYNRFLLGLYPEPSPFEKYDCMRHYVLPAGHTLKEIEDDEEEEETTPIPTEPQPTAVPVVPTTAVPSTSPIPPPVPSTATPTPPTPSASVAPSTPASGQASRPSSGGSSPSEDRDEADGDQEIEDDESSDESDPSSATPAQQSPGDGPVIDSDISGSNSKSTSSVVSSSLPSSQQPTPSPATAATPSVAPSKRTAPSTLPTVGPSGRRL